MQQFSFNEWQDLHNDNGWSNDDDFSGAREKTVTIFVNENVDYEFTGTLYEYANLPCEFYIEKIELVHYDDNGDELERRELESVPKRFIEEAERLAVENI